jgi:hypothetical protein
MTTRPFTTVTAVKGSTVEITAAGRFDTITDVDTVIRAGWHRPVNTLYFALKGRGVPVERVGDAIASRTMMEAVHEGERAARRIGAAADVNPFVSLSGVLASMPAAPARRG